MSSEIPRSEEFARQNNFRVELPDAERLYYTLDHSPQIRPEGFIPEFKIGTSQAKDALFSEIIVQAMVVEDAYLLHGGYSISVNLKYQNLTYQYWPKEEVEQLQEILTCDYGYTSIEHQTDMHNLSLTINSLIIRDRVGQLLYALNLGPENERTEWEHQIERDYSALSGEEALRQFMIARYPTPVNSSIDIKPIDADLNRPSSFNLLHHTIVDPFPDKTKAVKTFVTTTEKWAQFIEDAVNAMSRVKGAPQSGKLTLLPPSEIPQ